MRTFVDEKHDFFRHQNERRPKEHILLRMLRQSTGEDATDVVLGSQSRYVVHIPDKGGLLSDMDVNGWWRDGRV